MSIEYVKCSISVNLLIAEILAVPLPLVYCLFCGWEISWDKDSDIRLPFWRDL